MLHKFITKNKSSELIIEAVKNLDNELADHDKFYKGMEAEIEMKHSEAINQLSSTKQVAAKIDLNQIRFTEKVAPTDNQNKVIEMPNLSMRDELVKQGTEDFWLAGFENDADGKGKNSASL